MLFYHLQKKLWVMVAGLLIFVPFAQAQGNAQFLTRLEAMRYAPGTVDDGAPFDLFGSDVELSADGNTALIGAQGDDTGSGASAGSAYVYVRSGGFWTFQAKLTASDGAAEDSFGNSVSLSADGNTALIGAAVDDTALGYQGGSAYVFVRAGETWVEQQKLLPSSGTAFFGTSVSLSDDGNTALIGATYYAPPGGGNTGGAFVFMRVGAMWVEQQILVGGDSRAEDSFGAAVALSGDGNTALVGAIGDDRENGLSFGSAYIFVRVGSGWVEQYKFRASDGAPLDFFGGSVALSGDGNKALVGAAGHDTAAGEDAGAAYVFFRTGTTWSEQQKLTAPDGAARDAFGGTVSLSNDGNTLIVGAYNHNSGAAYVFICIGTTWSQQQKLVASDGSMSDAFGSATSLSGDGNMALVSSSLDDTPAGENAGSSYVFVRNGSTWSEQTHLYGQTSAPGGVVVNGAAHDFFGEAVDISADGSTAIVGSMGDDTSRGEDTGSAYIFVRSGTSWVFQAQLVASDGGVTDYFGSAVALSTDGNTVVIGAKFYNRDTINVGAAYVFVRSGTTWIEQQKFVMPDEIWAYEFGHSVDISGDGQTILIGMPYRNGFERGTGDAFIFTRTGTVWTEQQMLTPSDGASGDIFGISVALSADGNTALIGAQWHDSFGITDMGAAYVFVRNSGGVWTEQKKLTPNFYVDELNFGNAVALSANGSTALIGAYYRSVAFVFDRGGYSWSENGALTASDGAWNDLFGVSVALSADGNRAVVGAVWDDTAAGMDTGSAYTFDRTGAFWTQRQKLEAPDASPSDVLGTSVALSGDGRTIMAGAAYDDTAGGQDAGSAYVFVDPSPTAGSVDLLHNGGFEMASTRSVNKPDGWKVKNRSHDRMKCNVDVAVEGNCAFMFTGDKTRLMQTVDLTGYSIEEGDTLTFTLQYRTKGKLKPRLKLKLMVFYGDSTVPVMVNAKAKARAKGYQLFGTPIYTVNANSVTGIKVIIQNTKGVKVFVDEVSLMLNPADGEATK